MERINARKTILVPLISFTLVFIALKLFPEISIFPGKTALIPAITCYILGFSISIYCCKDFLQAQWKDFSQLKSTKYLWILAGYVLTILITTLSRKAVLLIFPTDSGALAEDSANPQIWMLLLSSLLPLLAPLYEELVFRHALFKQVATSTIAKILMALVSSIAFGLIHYSNLGSIIGTIPYMLVGLFFCWIYYKTNNIFYSIFVHLLLNWINTFMGIIGLLALSLING